MRSQSLLSKGVTNITFFGRNSKPIRGVQKFCGEKNRKFHVCSDWRFWREAGDRPTRSRASYMISLRSIFDFLWSVLNWKLVRGSKKYRETDSH